MRVLSALSALATAALVFAQSAPVVIDNLKTIQRKSDEVNTVAQSTNFANALYKNPQISAGLNDITTTIYQYISQQDNPPPVFGDADATAIVSALKNTASTQKQLLNTLIGKQGIFRALGGSFQTEPIRVTLSELEKAVDAFGFGLVNMIPTQAPIAQQELASLHNSFDSAVQAYS
ncbi:hypothetical protein M408DRAFT_325392 [Serendipita vermifera MAFF 305830]|uniref:Hydrophobic surface binding protein n=1 Tax=Serendipita vermifera MAFF 305830 TaxID=933852 RepID=A0A0C3BQR5_SERVB|nr:hypothetical protein M408DRAFT_325392 [Serendipita vermifera MAFF 305830]